MDILKNYNNGSGVFIQIGAGAGDLDKRANYSDGFSKFIKSLPRERIKKIVLVEPNPLNIPMLKECWKDFPEAIIYDIGIIPKQNLDKEINLYYCPSDAPHYQVASIIKEHVQKHYGSDCELKHITIKTNDINTFIQEITAEEIELLSIDIEGCDYEILSELLFTSIKVKFISFEYIHLGENEQTLKQYLEDKMYIYLGIGVDHSGYDYLYMNISNLLHPITFSIPEEKIVTNYLSLSKNKILSKLGLMSVGSKEHYMFDNEFDLYNEYKSSLFALTKKRAGWDCMRHYEILANGCIPYFPDINECPNNTMIFFPKQLILEGNLLYDTFKNKSFNELTNDDAYKYMDLVTRLLKYTKENLTTVKIAKYILKTTNNTNTSKILYLSGNLQPDYLRCLTLHGFKQLLGKECHDYPQVPHIYKDVINFKEIYGIHYGNGISYTNLLEKELHNNAYDNNIEELIKNKYFDIVIYGSSSRGMPYYNLVNEIYSPDKIILLFGEDECHSINNFKDILISGHHLFIRELK